MSCQAANHHRQMADFQKGSTVSASTSSESATDASTSSVSSSPVLSAGCKSSSPVFVNRNHMAEEGGCSSASSNHSGEVSQICREIETSESGLQQMSSKFKTLLTTPSRSREDVTGGYGSSNGGRLRNGGAARMEKLPPSPFSQKLAETAGNFRRPIPDHLANHPADILRRSLRSPTMMRLQESLGNISVVANDVNNVKTNGDADENSRDEYDDPSGSVTSSRCGTPKPFNCRTAQYRSFNLKRSGATPAAGGTERQRRILDQLASVRAQLKNRQENIKRTMSNHNIAGMTSVTGCNGVGSTLSNGGQKQ